MPSTGESTAFPVRPSLRAQQRHEGGQGEVEHGLASRVGIDGQP
jgi:hypothetical protein